MTEPRRIATVRDYNGLLAALRARRDELQITHQTIDEVSGIQSGYASKLLSDPPAKGLGGMSFGAVLGALGLQIEIVEDAQGFRQVADRLQKRRRPKRDTVMRTDDTHDRNFISVHRSHMRKISELAAVARKRIPNWKRKAMARKAARARWRKTAESSPQTTHQTGE